MVFLLPFLALAQEEEAPEPGFNKATFSGLEFRGIGPALMAGRWPEHAPFDAIVVTAAGPIIPPALLDQLRPGGRLVMPIGDPRRTQWLTVVDKDADGKITTRSVLEVVFVPLTGGD